jgi:hypothetical protein
LRLYLFFTINLPFPALHGFRFYRNFRRRPTGPGDSGYVSKFENQIRGSGFRFHLPAWPHRQRRMWGLD